MVRSASPRAKTEDRPSPMRPQLIGHRSETVRRANLSAIVRALHASGPLSRSELVARTGLTRSAIRGHVGELEAAGLVSRSARAARSSRPTLARRLARRRPRLGPGARDQRRLAGRRARRAGRARSSTIGRRQRPRGRSSVAEVVADLATLAIDVRSRAADAGDAGRRRRGRRRRRAPRGRPGPHGAQPRLADVAARRAAGRALAARGARDRRQRCRSGRAGRVSPWGGHGRR